MSPRFAIVASTLLGLSGCAGPRPSSPTTVRDASPRAGDPPRKIAASDASARLDAASQVTPALGTSTDPASAVEDAPAEPDDTPRPPSLGCGFASPMPGGFTAGYAADTGLDIAGIKMPVFAIAAGEIEYAEAGHSLWTGPHDTDLAVRMRLDEPIVVGERRVTHVWYAHLSAVEHEQPADAKRKRHVMAGDKIGTSGVANGAWHLHLGLLLDGDTTQQWGSFLLEDGVRKTLCGLRTRQRLAPLVAAKSPAHGVGTALAK